MVFIGGKAGSGKTVLFRQAQKELTIDTLTIEGKYDQLQQDEPFLGWRKAFSQLVQYVQSFSDTDIKNWRDKLLDTLEGNGKILTNIVPSLTQIIGKQPEVPSLESTYIMRRLYLTLDNFIQIFATKEKPLVIFLDDMQWMDTGSLNFLEKLATDYTIKNLTIVCTYRLDEIKKHEKNYSTLKKLLNDESLKNSIHSIEIDISRPVL
jgi:predicted ATPase